LGKNVRKPQEGICFDSHCRENLGNLRVNTNNNVNVDSSSTTVNDQMNVNVYNDKQYNKQLLIITNILRQNQSISQSINQSIKFARAPVPGDHWRRTSNLIKSTDRNQ